VTRYRGLENFNILGTLFTKKEKRINIGAITFKRRSEQNLPVQVLLVLGILGGDGVVQEALEFNFYLLE
jgi:hypothetical protein